jgi:ketosteroid isomerase-like protein
MSPEELIQAGYAAMNAGDLEGLMALLDPTIELRSLAVGSARGGWFRGYAGVRDWWDALTQTYDEFEFTLRGLDVEGDRAVAALTARFRIGDERIEHDAWQAARFRSGRIVLWARFATEDEARAWLGMATAQ